MARIHPNIPSSSSSCSNQRETYTVWMKSLVLNSNGYTVFDSSGDIVFRIDNYDLKSRSRVYLMDLRGNILCTILRKKLLRLGIWDCYNDKDSRTPWFEVGKASTSFFKNDSVYDVLVGTSDAQSVRSCSDHKMKVWVRNLEFKIIDDEGRVLAEVQRKRSTSGVMLGEDVLFVSVEAQVDRVFVMALVAIHGLIRNKM